MEKMGKTAQRETDASPPLPLLIKVAQKKRMAESSPWLASQPGVLAGAIPAGVFLSWNLAVTRQPGAGQTPRLACGVIFGFPQL